MDSVSQFEIFLYKMIDDPTVGKITLTVIGLLLIHLLARVISANIGRIVSESNSRYYLKKVIHFFSILISIFFLAAVFSDKIGSLSVALGVAGAGIAFALQEVIASVAGWLAILFGGFYSTGDRVQVGGTKGDVIDIGILRTTLMELGQWVTGDLYTGRIVRVANSFIFKEPVFNYSADFPFLWDEIQLSIKWGSDLEKATTLLEKATRELVGDFATQSQKAWGKVVNKYRIENASVDPMITYVIGSAQVDFTVRYIVNYKKRRGIKHELSRAFIKAIEEESSVNIAPVSEFQLTSVSGLKLSPT